MTDQHQPEDEQAAQINALRQALATRHSPLPWSWWTSCSFVRLSSDVTRCDGDVLRGEVHKDGQTSVAVTIADRDLIASAVNAAPVLLARIDALEQQPGPERIEAAAKALASAFAYPWEHMPEQGRENMRKHVRAVLKAVGVGGDQ